MEEKKKKKVEQKEMVTEVQRVHHKSVFDESEERKKGKGKQKKLKTHQSETPGRRKGRKRVRNV